MALQEYTQRARKREGPAAQNRLLQNVLQLKCLKLLNGLELSTRLAPDQLKHENTHVSAHKVACANSNHLVNSPACHSNILTRMSTLHDKSTPAFEKCDTAGCQPDVECKQLYLMWWVFTMQF